MGPPLSFYISASSLLSFAFFLSLPTKFAPMVAWIARCTSSSLWACLCCALGSRLPAMLTCPSIELCPTTWSLLQEERDSWVCLVVSLLSSLGSALSGFSLVGLVSGSLN